MSGSSGGPAARRAVVIVSGGDAVSPFTTPTESCAEGLAAGNTDTALREHLLGAGYEVYTSPAMNGRGVVRDQDGFGAFMGQPTVLPDHLTVNSIGDIDLAGEHLARFLTFLVTEFGVAELDIVGHSMGGLFSRAALRVLARAGSPLRIRSLTTIGTPWDGAMLAEHSNGFMPIEELHGDAFATRAVELFRDHSAGVVGAPQQITRSYLRGWNDYQAGILDDVPVTLIGGDHFHVEGADRRYLPFDGIVSASSALAESVPLAVAPHRTCLAFPDTHSIFVSDAIQAPWESALTWDPRVLTVVADAIAGA